MLSTVRAWHVLGGTAVGPGAMTDCTCRAGPGAGQCRPSKLTEESADNLTVHIVMFNPRLDSVAILELDANFCALRIVVHSKHNGAEDD